MNEPTLFAVEPLRDPTEPRVEAVGRSHPKTAKSAAVLVSLKASGERARILDALLVREHCHEAAFERGDERVPPSGFTAKEASEIIGSSPNQTAARMQSLRRDAWLEYTTDRAGEPLTRATDPSGKYRGLVHVFTAAGRAQWEARSRG